MHLPKNQTQVESQPKEGIRTTMMSSTISLDDVDPSTVVLGEDSDPSLPKKRKNSSGSSGTKRRKRNVIYKNGTRSIGTGPRKNAPRPPSDEDLIESRAITNLMMSEIFLRLRLNEAQRLMIRSVFAKYEFLRKHSPLMVSNSNKEKNYKKNLSSTLNDVEIIPKLACSTVLMDKLSKVLDDAPAFANERKHMDKTGKFVSCDKDIGLAKGYKHRGLTNDNIVKNARRDLKKIENKYDIEALEKAETLINDGLFILGRQRQVAKGKGSYY